MKRYYDYILRDNEVRLEHAMKVQIKSAGHKAYGAVDESIAYPEPKPAAYRAGTAIALYLNQKSGYYRAPEVYDFIAMGLSYIARNQREDGTFDLENCNFYSAPDTAFLIKPLISGYHLLQIYAFEGTECGDLKARLESIIEKAMEGLKQGGFHTPNHRWAIASVMASWLECSKEPKELMKHILAYLNEGIDCNEDGEYAERSAATYNVVNNSAMLALYEHLHQDLYLEYFCRNLNMMLHYFEPDGSIFTENSTRQDKGKRHYPRDYFIHYLYAAWKTGEQKFADAAHQIISDHMHRRDSLAPDCLARLMLHPELMEYTFTGRGFPQEYRMRFAGSGVVRISNARYSCSLVEHSTKMLFFKTRESTLYLKMHLGYFDQRNVVIQSVEEKDGAYHLRYKASGWYYLPFEEKPDTNDWWQMNNAGRRQMIKNDLQFHIVVTPTEYGLDIHTETAGCDRVKIRFEIGLPPQGFLENDQLFLPCREGHSFLLKQDSICYRQGPGHPGIQIGPGCCAHRDLEGKFGSEEQSVYHQTVYFTAETNFSHSFSIKALPISQPR